MAYRAFFSYARADDRIANWLHRQIDGYRTPKSLVGQAGALGSVPETLHPIFRDRTDLQAGGHIDDSLQRALEESESLIVLCSPTSAKSRWVEHECATFLKLGREARIFPVIADGVPDSGDDHTECFPPSLRNRGLLAADLREIKRPNGQIEGDGREGGRLKLIAGLLGVSLDDLVRRERRRQRLAIVALSAASLVFAAVAGLATVFWFSSERNARVAEDNAARAQSTLRQFFTARSWERLRAGDHYAAARYAIAGYRVDRANADEAQSALAALLHAADVARTSPLYSGAPIVHVSNVSDRGDFVLSDRAGGLHYWTIEGPSSRFSRDPVGSPIYGPTAANSPTMAAISANAEHIASVSQFRASVAEMSTGESFSLPGGEYLAAAFQADGTLVTATATAFEFWDVDRRTSALELATHTRQGRTYFAQDARTALSIDERNGSNQATLYDLVNQRSTRILTGYVEAASFSSDGRFLATGGTDDRARIWNGATGNLGATLIGHARDVVDVQFSADGTLLITASRDQSAKIWRVPTGQLVRTLEGHDGFLRSAAISPDNRLAATGGEDNRVVLWDIASGSQLRAYPPERGAVSHVEFLPDGETLLVTTDSGVTRTWRVDRPSVVMRHADWVMSGAFAPDGATFVTTVGGTVAGGEVLSLWNRWRDAPRRVASAPGACCATYSPNGEQFAVGLGRRVRVYRASDAVLSFELTAFNNFVTDIVFTGDGRIITASADNNINFWRARDGELGSTLRVPGVVSIALSPNGGRLAVATGDETVRMLDAQSQAELGRFSFPAVQSVSVVEFSPDGRHIAIGGSANEVILADSISGAVVGTLSGHVQSPFAISFSPDARSLATASWDGTARIWSVSTSQTIAILGGHNWTVTSASFSPDSQYIVTTSYDRTARVWDARYLSLSLPDLIERACEFFLDPSGTYFTDAEIAADPLLRAEWQDAERSVCDVAAQQRQH